MDYKEALEKHKKDCRRCREKICKYTIKKISCLQEVDIKAYEELMSYRRIGTLEEVREAMEKQKAKKPKDVGTEGYRYTDTYRCPTCGGNFSGTGIADYCYHCRQAIDWSEVDE